MKKQEELILTRKFLGKTEGFKDKQERNFENKHLKAYLNGHTHFIHGRTKTQHGEIFPVFHDVKQEFNFVVNPRFKK
jgi:hypothetical protein